MTRPEDFWYTCQSGTYTVPGIDDRKEFEDCWVHYATHTLLLLPPSNTFSATKNAMKTIGFSQQEMHDIYRLIASVLWIGNIDFKPDAKGQSAVTDRQSEYPSLLRSTTILTAPQSNSC